MKTVLLLWSGGWDGTFRLLQLATESICIQPIYVIDENRGSLDYEQEAMKKILNLIKTGGGGYGFKAQILDIKYYEAKKILLEYKNEEISSAFNYLRGKYDIGIQYEWFALLANHFGIKIEAGLLLHSSKVEKAIKEEGTLTLIQNDILSGRYKVLPKGNNNKAFLVFGNLILPLIKLTKRDEERIANDNGWMDIMKLTWFCFTPIKGEPCGLCNPCKDAMNSGMEWRMPKKARRRYNHRKIYLFARKVKKHLHSRRA